jgi:hypothetical protein
MGWKQDMEALKQEVLALEARCQVMEETITARGNTAQANAMREWLDNRVREAMGTFSSYAAELQAAELASSESEDFANGRADVISSPFDYSNKTWRGEATQVKVCRSAKDSDAQALLAAAFNQLAGERFEVPLYDENLIAQLWVVNPGNPWPWTFIRDLPAFNTWSEALQVLDTRVGSCIRTAIRSHTAHAKWKGSGAAGAGMPKELLATLSMLEDADKFAPGYEFGNTLPRRICGNYGRGDELVGVRVRLSYGNTTWLESQRIRILESEYLVTRKNQDGSEVEVTPLAQYIHAQHHPAPRWYFNARFVDQRDAVNYGGAVFWYTGEQPTFTTGTALQNANAKPAPANYIPAWVEEVRGMSKPSKGVKTLVTSYLNAMQDVPRERQHSYYDSIRKWRSRL